MPKEQTSLKHDIVIMRLQSSSKMMVTLYMVNKTPTQSAIAYVHLCFSEYSSSIPVLSRALALENAIHHSTSMHKRASTAPSSQFTDSNDH